MNESQEPLNGDDEAELEARLLGATARMNWSELQRFFARGRVLNVAADLNLIEVSKQLIEDNAAQFKAWVDGEQIAHVGDDVASEWFACDKAVWVTVVAPWVLVQDKQQDKAEDKQ